MYFPNLVLLKSSINGWIIFECISSLILYITYSLINIQLISYSILIGQLFNSSSRFFLLNLILFVLFTIISFKELDENVQLLFCLNPYYSYLCLTRYLFIYERSMMKSLNVNEKYFQWIPSLFNIYLIQSISILIYWILIWYFDKIYPGLLNFNSNLNDLFYVKVNME